MPDYHNKKFTISHGNQATAYAIIKYYIMFTKKSYFYTRRIYEECKIVKCINRHFYLKDMQNGFT